MSPVARFALGAGLVLIGLAPAAQAAAPAGAAAPLSLGGAWIGMSRSAWMAMDPPSPRSAPAERRCAPEGARPGRTDPAQAPVVVCAYDQAIGRFRLPVSTPLTGGLRATGARYTFVGDRLTRIAYDLPVDAYNQQVAALRARFGPATSVRRDLVQTEIGPRPRVTQRWATPTGRVELIDPVPPYSRLRIRLMAR